MKKCKACRLILYVLFSILAYSNVYAQDSYVFGVFPSTSPAKLLRSHLPLRYYLEDILAKPIVMTTAPSMESFVKRTKDGEYDFILTPPHLGWLSEKRDDYQFVAATGHKIQGVFISRKDSDIESLEEIEGKKVIMAEPESLLFQLALEELNRFGYNDKVNIEIINADNHSNALIAPIQRKGEVALTTVSLWTKFGSNYKDDLQVVGHTHKMPGLLIMANPRVGEFEVAQIRNALVNFSETENGTFYLSYTGFRRFKNIDINVRKSTEKYISFAQN